MNNRTYRTRKRRFDRLYKARGVIGDPCVYCSLISTNFDHVPPLHYVANLSNADIAIRRPCKYPACQECNSILTGLLILQLKARIVYVKDKLRRRYKSYIKMPMWDADDIDDLNTDEQRRIQLHSQFAETVRRRIAYYHHTTGGTT